MGKGKDTQSSKNRSAENRNIDPVLEERGDRMSAFSQFAAALGYQPNRGVTIAGFTPMQQAGFQNISNAASAFGMARPQNAMAGMPQTQTQGGIAGYSTGPHFDAMVSQLPPQFQQALASLFMNMETGQGPSWATAQLTPDNPYAYMAFGDRHQGHGYYGPKFNLFSPPTGEQQEGGNLVAPTGGLAGMM